MKKRPMESDEEIAIEKGEGKFRRCIVWTPLPCLTWLFPPIGHLGITETSGLIHDFVGKHGIITFFPFSFSNFTLVGSLLLPQMYLLFSTIPGPYMMNTSYEVCFFPTSP
jgi:hypothetical protein